MSDFESETTYNFSDGSIMTVSGVCFQTYPCKHHITIDGVQKMYTNASDIVAYFEEKKLKIPEHFEYISEGLMGI